MEKIEYLEKNMKITEEDREFLELNVDQMGIQDVPVIDKRQSYRCSIEWPWNGAITMTLHKCQKNAIL